MYGTLNVHGLMSLNSTLLYPKKTQCKKNKINIGPCPTKDAFDACGLFLSRLGCTAAILRIPRFHDFLSMPQSVRDGLTYASHKPFGKTLREGEMQKHPRFVRSGAGKRWITLTKDERGGSLLCALDEQNKGFIVSSLKIGASTELQPLQDKGIPCAFVLKSGKRQWVLQGLTKRDYMMWNSQLMDMLKEFGPVKLNSAPSLGLSNDLSSKPALSDSPSNNNSNARNAESDELAKLMQTNMELNQRIKELMADKEKLDNEVNDIKDRNLEMEANEQELRNKGRNNFLREKEDLIQNYEVKQYNLRTEIEKLHQRLEEKTATEGGKSALKNLMGNEFFEYKFKENMDDEKDGVVYEDMIGVEDAPQWQNEVKDKKIVYKHLHKHEHKHIHLHRHLHVHDHRGAKPVSYTQTHTIAHTITHSLTQFKVKKLLFATSMDE